MIKALAIAVALVLAMPNTDVQPSAIVAQKDALREDFTWGSLYSYYKTETFGTKDVLAAVAVIKPGREIHPPHQHAEEEYLMVVAGNGTWSASGNQVCKGNNGTLIANPANKARKIHHCRLAGSGWAARDAVNSEIEKRN